jgi:Conserved TM helix
LNFADRLQASLAQLWDFIPGLLGAAVVLVAGYLLAKAVQKGALRVLRRVHLNDMLRKGGVMQAVDRPGSHFNPTRVVAGLLFWLVMFTVMLVAADALGFDSLAQVFSELVGYIPSVVVAIVIVILGIVLGDIVSGLIHAGTGALHGGPTLARAGKGGVIILAVFMSLQQLGVATNIVTTAFAIIFGAVALALALSFGLGNRELAGEITRGWYERYKAEREAIDQEAKAEETAEGLVDDDAVEPRAPVHTPVTVRASDQETSITTTGPR